jgi:hypothetical protein
MDPSSVEQATLTAIRNMPWSITLADPGLDDCPLIGCSDGFEIVTGYRRQEIIGQNCRFLNENAGLDPALRAPLREAVRLGREFIGIIPNVRKDGSRFQNLLHLSPLEVRGRNYIIGIQAALNNVDVNLNSPGHIETLRATVDCIFQGNIDAWVQMQAREFSMRLPAPYSQLLKLCSPSTFERERDLYVRLGDSGNAADEIQRKEAAFSSRIASRDVATSDPPIGLASVGSIGHPHNCKECHFHMFNADGCRLGRNCTYCHEVHPRANPKKNRRFMRRIMKNGIVTPDALSGTSGTHVPKPEVPQAAIQNVVAYPATLSASTYSVVPPAIMPVQGVNAESSNSGSQKTHISREEVKHERSGVVADVPVMPIREMVTSQNLDMRAKAEPVGEVSIGSRGHPNNCRECHFFMFDPNGCRSGASCQFCHSLHPRVNPKKNRRFMRRIAGNGFSDLPAVAQKEEQEHVDARKKASCNEPYKRYRAGRRQKHARIFRNWNYHGATHPWADKFHQGPADSKFKLECG